MPEASSYDYAVIRVAPRFERGEFINAGVILFARTRRFLAAQLALDVDRLCTLFPGVDVAMVAEQLALIPRICAGEGPVGRLGQAEAFHWLVAPHSTVIHCGPVHSGITREPGWELERLERELVSG